MRLGTRWTPAGAAVRPAAAPAVPGSTLAVRVVGAGLLLAMGAIHLRLWADGYRVIAWIGPLFLADAVLGLLAALALLLAPPRRLPWVGLLAALLQIGTLGGLVLALTVGLLGFSESLSAPLVVPAIGVEAAGFLLLGGFAARRLRGARHGSPRARG